MIISDKYKFVFVHIPKNAGTEVRSLIQRFDDTKGRFENPVECHPSLGTIDYAHLPLRILEKYFPEEYKKIINYKTFAIVRNPTVRFISSFSQHLRQTNQKPIHEITSKEQLSELLRIIDWLKENDQLEILPSEYVHFTPQHKYIFNGNEEVIENLFLTTQIVDVAKFISDLTGETIAYKSSRKNPTYQYKNSIFRSVCESIRPLYRVSKKCIPEITLEWMRDAVYKKGSESYLQLLNDPTVEEFVHEFYKKDFELYETLQGRNR